MTVQNLKNRRRGDTSESVEFSVINSDTNTGIDLTGASILCQFRYGSQSGSVKEEFTIGNGITVNDAVNGEFQIDQIEKLDWAEGTYFYDVQLLLSDGRTKTYVGGSFKVVGSVSKP